MSLLRTLLAPKASTQNFSDPSGWLINGGFGRKTISGEQVNPATALTLSTWFACIRNVSEDVGKLPLYIYERQAGGGKKKATDHPLFQMLYSTPNGENTAMVFRETMTGWVMGWGNGYAEIERNGAGTPVALWPIHPARVRVSRIDGVIKYAVWSPELGGRRAVGLDARDVLHVRGFGDDPMAGLSVARMAAESIGLSLAMETFGAAFFGNGATLGVTLEHPGTLTEQAQVRLRESWNKIHAGADNAHKLAILEEGMKANRVTVPPNEAQFIEARNFQIDEIARWFRMPPHKIQQLARSTNNNIEHQGIEYTNDCLMPWCRRWETEFERKLLDDRGRTIFEIRHDMDELMRGDAASRSTFYSTMIAAGAMKPNEARERESLNPVDPAIGDVLYMQGAMSTLKRIVEGPPAPVAPSAGAADAAPPAPGTDAPMPADQKKGAQKQAHALLAVLADAEARCRRKEEMAIATAVRKYQVDTMAMISWAREFYDEHAKYLVSALLPGLNAIDQILRSADPSRGAFAAVLDEFMTAHVARARAHAIIAGTAFTPEQPLAQTLFALLTLEPAHA